MRSKSLAEVDDVFQYKAIHFAIAEITAEPAMRKYLRTIKVSILGQYNA